MITLEFSEGSILRVLLNRPC